jgi:hypothetical protein
MMEIGVICGCKRELRATVAMCSQGTALVLSAPQVHVPKKDPSTASLGNHTGDFAERFLILALELRLSVWVGERVADRWLMVLKGSSTISAERFLVLVRDLSLSVQACV